MRLALKVVMQSCYTDQPILESGARKGWVVSATPRPFNPQEGEPVPIVQEAVWAPGPVWMGPENVAPTGVPIPDRPARSESPSRLPVFPFRLFLTTA